MSLNWQGGSWKQEEVEGGHAILHCAAMPNANPSGLDSPAPEQKREGNFCFHARDCGAETIMRAPAERATIWKRAVGLTAPIEEEMPYRLNMEPIPSMLTSWDARGCRILP